MFQAGFIAYSAYTSQLAHLIARHRAIPNDVDFTLECSQLASSHELRNRCHGYGFAPAEFLARCVFFNTRGIGQWHDSGQSLTEVMRSCAYPRRVHAKHLGNIKDLALVIMATVVMQLYPLRNY